MTLAGGFSFSRSFQTAFTTMFNYVPQLIGALIVLVVGYLVARLVEKVVGRVLARVRVNEAARRAGVQEVLDRSGMDLTPAALIAKVVFWFIFVIVLTMFASALGVPQITGFMNRMIAYIPNIFAALVILFLAIAFSHYLAGLVRGLTNSQVLARAAQIGVLVYAVFVVLVQLHIAQTLTGPTFLIVLAGAALAAGLAFGLGGRAEAERFISRLVNGESTTASNGAVERPDGGSSPS